MLNAYRERVSGVMTRARWSLGGDVLLVVALLALTWQGVYAGNGAPHPRWLTFTAMLPGILVLPWRRRIPLAALAIAIVPAVAAWLTIGSPENLGSVVPPTILLYTIGRWEPSRRGATIAVALSPLVLFIHEWRDPHNTTWHQVLLALPYDALVPVAWLLGAFLRLRQEQSAHRVEQLIHAERTRIARELHDVVAHGLAVIVVQAEGAAEVVHADPVRARVAIERVAQTGRDSLVELRRALGMLRDGPSSSLESLPGLSRLDDLVGTVRASGLRVDRQIMGQPHTLSPVVDLALYRVIQEALTNTMRHADARRASVCIEHRPGAVRVSVTDDGRATPGTASGGGLLGIKERIVMLGGEVEVGPLSTGGFRVAATVPLEQA